MDREQALRAFSALAHADRLDLIRLLVRQGPEGLAAGQIGAALGGLTASRLSFHLAALEAAGLISARKSARNVIYAVKAAALGGLLAYLMRDCCGNDPQILACCQPQGEAGTDKT
jgi:ArsR family transcriptional regulator